MDEQQRARLEELNINLQSFQNQWFPGWFPCITELQQLVSALQALLREVGDGGEGRQLVANVLNSAQKLLDERKRNVAAAAELAQAQANMPKLPTSSGVELSVKTLSTSSPPTGGPPPTIPRTAPPGPIVPQFGTKNTNNCKLIGQGVSTLGQIMEKEGKTKVVKRVGMAVHVFGEVLSRVKK